MQVPVVGAGEGQGGHGGLSLGRIQSIILPARGGLPASPCQRPGRRAGRQSDRPTGPPSGNPNARPVCRRAASINSSTCRKTARIKGLARPVQWIRHTTPRRRHPRQSGRHHDAHPFKLAAACLIAAGLAQPAIAQESPPCRRSRPAAASPSATGSRRSPSRTTTTSSRWWATARS
jgi:hypothetical protein